MMGLFSPLYIFKAIFSKTRLRQSNHGYRIG